MCHSHCVGSEMAPGLGMSSWSLRGTGGDGDVLSSRRSTWQKESLNGDSFWRGLSRGGQLLSSHVKAGGT